ncbi:uncharacterized protein NPIL_343671 [Nephila pilipes]|uniref:DNA-directed DNA polymerase n=1 Tax=Nephila pilipes TaxID=299642 RepID=A0A8X6MZH5_NEPPI|nr:uncharacterized protein NPIL_343671 [Nephila pilipes]
MKHRYDSKIKLMYTDTDSFIYEINTDDFYSDMKDDLNLYDTSDYDKNNVYNLPLVNKKVIGKMKDENKGNIMTEYVGLSTLKTKTKTIAEGKQLNSTSACAACSACSTCAACLRLRSLLPQNRLFLPTGQGRSCMRCAEQKSRTVRATCGRALSC